MTILSIDGEPVLYVAPPSDEKKRAYTYYARCTIDGALTSETTYNKAAAAVRKHIKKYPDHSPNTFVSYFPDSGS